MLTWLPSPCESWFLTSLLQAACRGITMSRRNPFAVKWILASMIGVVIGVGGIAPKANAQYHGSLGIGEGARLEAQPHWGCFGYCNGPLRPAPQPHWGCFGYCPGPLPHHRQQYWGCLGYCNGPITPV